MAMTRAIAIILLLMFGITVAVAADEPRKGGAEGRKAVATEVRDWEAIDKNDDHYIQPHEMQAYLESGWAKAKKASK
jgi:hypothetical protein